MPACLRSTTCLKGAFGRRMLALVGLTLMGPAWAMALSPGVPELAPSDPKAIFSIPDTAALWNQYSATPLAKSVVSALADPAWVNSDQFVGLEAQVQNILEQTGVSLWPADVLGQLLRSVDVYVIERDGRPRSVFVFGFQRAGVNQMILDQVRKDAEESRGVSGGFAASAVEDKEGWNKKYIHLPAFDLYLAAEGEKSLVMASSEEALFSSLRGTGQEFFNGEFFRTMSGGLGREPAQAWAVGDVGRLTPVLTRVLPVPGMPAAGEDAFRGSIGINFQPKFIKLSLYTPTSEMDAARRRVALAAPAGSSIEVLEYFAPDAMFSYGTNHFDGLVFLEHALEKGTAAGLAGVSREAVQEQIDATRTAVGFDLKSDLLANIGPALGFSITELELPSPTNGLSTPRVDALLVVGVRNRPRFDMVLGKVEGMFAQPGDAANELLTVQEIEGTSVRVLREPVLATLGITPSYTVDQAGAFVFGLSVEGITAALERRAGSKGSLPKSAPFRAAGENLIPLRNEIMTLSGARLASLVEDNAANLTAPVPHMPAARLAEVLRTITTVVGNTIYQRDGRKVEVLLALE